MHEYLCVCVSVYTCVKCKQNGCHCFCCCCDENAVANTKRAKNASKLLESWKIEFCALPGRTLRTAHTHTYKDRHTRIENSMGLCWFFFLAYYTRLLQMHIVNPFGHKGKHTHPYMQPQAHIDTQMAFEFE